METAVTTARHFFGSEPVRFAAVDGTEHTHPPSFYLVIFFGGVYAARGHLRSALRESDPLI